MRSRTDCARAASTTACTPPRRPDRARADPGDLHVEPDPLPDQVAATAYYVVSEAIANAIKHAEATRIDVRVARRDGHVEVRVADDGRGGAARRGGSGLAGLRDRVDAVGGVLALVSDGRHGTAVEAVVPCAS